MRAATWLALLLVALLPAPAQAQDAKIAEFSGTYQGSGVAEGRDNVYFTIVARDLDVTVKPTDGGFDVTWTTITQGTTRGQRVVRKTETVSFAKTEKPNVFRAATPVEPMSGAPYYWARISGRSLTVYAMTIAGSGAYELTSWARTLNPNGMDLVFRRLSDGEAVRTVRGKLVKVAP
jgi:hypothetical protein